MAEAEIESLEQLLDKAGSEPLEQRELAEVKRILYGSPVGCVVFFVVNLNFEALI